MTANEKQNEQDIFQNSTYKNEDLGVTQVQEENKTSNVSNVSTTEDDVKVTENMTINPMSAENSVNYTTSIPTDEINQTTEPISTTSPEVGFTNQEHPTVMENTILKNESELPLFDMIKNIKNVDNLKKMVAEADANANAVEYTVLGKKHTSNHKFVSFLVAFIFLAAILGIGGYVLLGELGFLDDQMKCTMVHPELLSTTTTKVDYYFDNDGLHYSDIKISYRFHRNLTDRELSSYHRNYPPAIQQFYERRNEFFSSDLDIQLNEKELYVDVSLSSKKLRDFQDTKGRTIELQYGAKAEEIKKEMQSLGYICN